MVIRAVIFDIGGVLEITEPTGWGESWARRLDLSWAETWHGSQRHGRPASSEQSISPESSARPWPSSA